jgi:L-amino acid N-acyltransferase YncA
MPQFHMRVACRNDVDTLFRWLNDPTSISAKLVTTSVVRYESHCDWFDHRLADEKCKIWIAIHDDIDVGQARVQLGEDQELEVDIYVDKEARCKGIAFKILEYVAKECKFAWPHSPLIATIRNDNSASIALFSRAGYKKLEQNNTFLKMKRLPQ